MGVAGRYPLFYRVGIYDKPGTVAGLVCLGALENQASAVLLNSRIAASSAFSSLVRSRSWGRIPPCQALRDTCALPSGVLGPVDFCHGLHCLINSACRRRRSNVQPLAMFRLQ